MRNDRVGGLVGTFSPRPYRQWDGDEPVSATFAKPNRSSTQTFSTVTGTYCAKIAGSDPVVDLKEKLWP